MMTLVNRVLLTKWVGAIALVAMQPAVAEATLLGEMEPAATTVDEWVTQIAQADLVEITSIQIDQTTEGFTLRFETSGELSAPETSTISNTVISDIPNAVLRLPEREDFLISDPIAGVALINVTNLPNNQIRIAITGTDAPPVVDISIGVAGLTVSATPGVPTAQAPDDDSIRIVVTGEGEGDYFVPSANTATRTDTPILDVPQSIQVVPQEVLEDQQIIRVDDALRNVSGVIGRLNTFGTGNITIRGFTTANFTAGAIFRDGFRVSENLGTQETANIERIEVIKGPSSVLYGQNDPGGIINLVTKRPLDEPFYGVEAQIGSYGLLRPSIDITGPLNEDRSLRYRLNASQQIENGFRDFKTETDRFFIAPVLSWDISDRTNLTLLLEYTDEEDIFDLGLVASGDGIVDVPRDRNLGELDDFFSNSSLTLGYDLKHQFSDDWMFNHGVRYIAPRLLRQRNTTVIL